MKRGHFFAFLFAYCITWGQNLSPLQGLRVYGEKEEDLPVARIDGQPITIEFDVGTSAPKDFRMKLFHCDMDWKVTENSFINDELKNVIQFPVPYEPAPKFVRYYTYHYKVRIPGFAGLDTFPHSGNYIFQLWEKGGKEPAVTRRFFVVERIVIPSITVRNRLLPSTVSPWNQVNKVEVSFSIPQPRDVGDEFSPMLLKTVDVYKNRRLTDPYRISADDDSPHTFVEGWGLSKVRFVVDNVQPGNEYRRLDLTNVDHYPPDKKARPREGADVSRFLLQGPRDNNGASHWATDDRYADYIQYQFELLRDSDDLDSVYVVGDFNEWTPSRSWFMTYASDTKRYVLSAWLRRGVYDYQYVLKGNDWISVEGNDWRTVNLYTAFVYYHDPRFGGFDRILGYAQTLGPGGIEATSN